MAGLNIANVSVSGSSPTVTDPSKIYGLSLGIRGKFFFPTFSNKISLDLGVAYNKKGASFTKDKAEFNLNYMDLYTLIKYNYPKGKIRPTIGVGGLYGMLLKKNNAYSGANGDLFVDNTVKTEIGYVIEAGFNYLLNDAHQIVVILGYEKTTIPFNFLLQGYGNNVIGLKVGYSF